MAGREGKFVTSRQIRDRLYRETLKDVSLKVTDTDRDSAFNVQAGARCLVHPHRDHAPEG